MSKTVVIFVVSTAAVLALILWAALTHTEAGLVHVCPPSGHFGTFTFGKDCPELTWPKAEVPLLVSIGSEDERQHGDNLSSLGSAVRSINSRLGFTFFAVTAFDPSLINVVVHFQVAHQSGGMDSSGRAIFTQTANGLRCDVDVSNTGDIVGTGLVLEHELLHAAGLDHDEDADSIMYGHGLRAGEDYRLSDSDRSLLRKLYLKKD